MFLKIRLPSSVLVCLYIAAAECFPGFQGFIPNGNNVPNPCTTDKMDTWPSVGHKISLMESTGDNKTNKFGEDFKIALDMVGADSFNRGVWFFLCGKDSDGDSRTNGKELGDPNCTWNFDQPDSLEFPSDPITHPGIPDAVDGTMSEKYRAEYCPLT